MDQIILSICIPVYNRESELRECLKTIENNFCDGLEVVISDNNSTDGTVEIIRQFATRIPIKWQQQEVNVGFDQNCIDVVSISSGQYCWILGSDDKILDEAIEKLISSLLTRKPDIAHFGYIQNGVEIKPTNDLHGRLYETSDEDAKDRHLSELQNLSLAFMFISCFVFQRDKWIVLESLLEEVIGSNYVHSFGMYSIFNDKSSILIIDDLFVDAKVSKNEWTDDIGRFLFIDSSAIITVKDKISFEESRYSALCKVFRKTYPLHLIFKIIVAGGGKYFIKSKNNLSNIGYSCFELNILRLCQISGIFLVLTYLNIFRRHVIRIRGQECKFQKY